jgi:hydroxymethylpyrimidine pyrophosphatase-like HAD family hydrolase
VYCRVIACDFDGTGATNGHPAPELYAALGAARAQGIVTLLVTGRVLEDVATACEDLSPFDGVVAENGAVVHLCSLSRTIQIGSPPPEHFLGELRARGVPFHTGNVVVGTWERHAAEVLDLVHRFGIDVQLVFNRGALMMLPSGVNKAVGIRRALDELGRSEHNLVVFGDAENDIPMFIAAEFAVAARNAVATVAALADDTVTQPGGAGVALYIRKVLNGLGVMATPARHSVTLGTTDDGLKTTFPTSGVNAVISGDPRSGKSWIAGLIAEQLVEQGYRICVIDPEGDYAQIGRRPKIVTLGDELPLPPPQAVVRLLNTEPLSLVLALSSLAPREQVDYVRQLLPSLQQARDLTGTPHWILIDEAHYFFHESTEAAEALRSPSGNYILVTYRPSLLDTEVYNIADAHIITSTKVEEERYFVTKIFQARGPKGLSAHEALSGIEMPRAGLLLSKSPTTPWLIFRPEDRVTRHAHHARKYADTRLPDEKAFRFAATDGPVTAHNMVEFYEAIKSVSLASLRHHLTASDFSRWVGEVVGDQQLAKGLRKVERSTPTGANPDRAEILAHIEDHYLIQKE